MAHGPPSWTWMLVLALIVTIAFGFWLEMRRRSRRKPPVPLKNKAEIELTELLPDSKFIEIDEARVHYVQAGRGSDVILLHGIGASVFIWRFVLPLLQIRHRVTAIDLLGFGKSSKHAMHDYGLDGQCELVIKTLDRLGIGKAALVGSSMGGAIALWLAGLSPTRFNTVVALAPATDRSRIPRSAQHFAVFAPLMRRTLNRRTMKLILTRVVARKDLITDEVVDHYLHPFRDRGESVRAFWSALSLLTDSRLPEGLAGLKAQVLVIYGARDQIVRKRSMTDLMAVLPQAKLIIHETAGHHIMEDEPTWITEQIENFLTAKI